MATLVHAVEDQSGFFVSVPQSTCILKHNSCCASVHPAHASALLMWFDVGTIGLHCKGLIGMSSRPSRDARKKLQFLILGVVEIISAFSRKKGKYQKYRNLQRCRKRINIRDVR